MYLTSTEHSSLADKQGRGISLPVLQRYLVGAVSHTFRDDDGRARAERCVVFPWAQIDEKTNKLSVRRLKV